MRIDNTYTQRQQNFGSLKSIKYWNDNCRNRYPKEFAELLNTIKESKAFTEFFQKYDVDVSFNKRENLFGANWVSMKLDTMVKSPEGENHNPILSFGVNGRDDASLINKLTQKIKNIEFSDLKNKLDDSLKQIEAKEKMEKSKAERVAMNIAELDNITNSLLMKNIPEVPKKKTFFEKLFGWLK